MTDSAFRTGVGARVATFVERGGAPWLRRWDGDEAAFLPMNGLTAKSYHGANAVSLMSTRFGDPRWCTEKQAVEAGWTIQPGEVDRPMWVEYWTWPEKGSPKASYGKLYNFAQLDGPPAHIPEVPRTNALELLEEVLQRADVAVFHDQPAGRAFYLAARNEIHVPPPGLFPADEEYASVVFNKLVYATGSPQWLGRPAVGDAGSAEYLRERLRCEMATLFITDRLGLPFIPAMPANEWKAVAEFIRGDANEFFDMAKEAEEIASYVIDLSRGRAIDKSASREPVVTEEATQKRIYLFVPYEEREAADKAGADWDKQKKRWYVTPGKDSTALDRWRFPPSIMDAERAFAEDCEAAGLIAPKEGFVLDGRWHNCKVVGGKGNNTNGSFLGSFDPSEGKGHGFVRNFRDESLSGGWSYDGAGALNRAPVDVVALAAERAAREAKRAAEEAAERERISKTCTARVAALKPATNDHGYCRKKGINAFGLHLMGNKLVVPMRDRTGKIWSLQYIDPEGDKLFVPGGRKSGCFHILGNWKPGGPILVCEGYATGASIHMATGIPVAVAFDSGNLLGVARELKEMGADVRLICGDDDRFLRCPIGWKEDKETGAKIMVSGRKKALDAGAESEFEVLPGAPNAGVEKATEAAEAIGSVAVFPQFKDSNWWGTDYNDLAKESGLGAVRIQVMAALEVERGHQQQRVATAQVDQSRAAATHAPASHVLAPKAKAKATAGIEH